MEAVQLTEEEAQNALEGADFAHESYFLRDFGSKRMVSSTCWPAS